MRRIRTLGGALIAGVGLLAVAGPAQASVERIVVKSREPFHKSRVGPYLKIEGVFTGSLDPKTEPIPELSKVKRRADGRVEYASDFIILTPESTDNANRILVFDVENNGRPVTHGLYNSPIDGVVGDLEVGNAFLEDQGFIVAVASWQGGHGITLPEYDGPDGKPVPVAAAGFAAIRDFAYFLRFEANDKSGTENPLAGVIDLAVAAGSSQAGRFLKSFVHHGFNTTSGRRVFEGLHIHVAEVGSMPLMPPPGADAAVVQATITGDSAVSPYTFADVMAPLKGRRETAPRILVTNVEGDYYRRRLSLLRTGPKGTADVALPENVRAWDVAGGSHAVVLDEACEMPRANLDWHPLLRAGLFRLVQWASGGDLLPPTKLLTLVPAENAPFLSPAPADLPGATLMVPRRDADGNAEGGIRLPAVAVPLGTIRGWNTPWDNTCGDMSTAWLPFAASESQRASTEDTRPALTDRYESPSDYVAKYRAVARQLVTDGYLLEMDAAAMVAAVDAKVVKLFPGRASTAR